MGAGTRHLEIRRRRKRRQKRAKKQLSGLRKAIKSGRTHADRAKLAEEYWKGLRAS